MNRTIIALSALLGLQVALAAGLHLWSGGLAAPTPGAPLLAFAPDTVARMTITAEDGQAVTLARRGGAWVLPGQEDFPADGDKVETLLADLTKARQGPPIATSGAAPERFRVAADAFARKLVFAGTDGPLATLYVGTAQGARQVHVRREDQDAVYRIGFSAWRAPADADSWLDTALLEVAPDAITALAWNGLRVERRDAAPDTTAESRWRLAGAEDGTLSDEVVEPLIDRLARLRITGLVAEDERARFDGVTPVLTMTIALGDAERRYTILKAGEESPTYAIRSTTRPELMALRGVVAEDLVEAFVNAENAIGGAAAAPSPPQAAEAG